MFHTTRGHIVLLRRIKISISSTFQIKSREKFEMGEKIVCAEGSDGKTRRRTTGSQKSRRRRRRWKPGREERACFTDDRARARRPGSREHHNYVNRRVPCRFGRPVPSAVRRWPMAVGRAGPAIRSSGAPKTGHDRLTLTRARRHNNGRTGRGSILAGTGRTVSSLVTRFRKRERALWKKPESCKSGGGLAEGGGVKSIVYRPGPEPKSVAYKAVFGLFTLTRFSRFLATPAYTKIISFSRRG